MKNLRNLLIAVVFIFGLSAVVSSCGTSDPVEEIENTLEAPEYTDPHDNDKKNRPGGGGSNTGG